MYSVYDVIEVLRKSRGYTIKEMVQKTTLPYTTVASMMNRRPKKIAMISLVAIAGAFDLQWYELLGIREDRKREAAEEVYRNYSGRNINGARLSTILDDEAMERAITNFEDKGYENIRKLVAQQNMRTPMSFEEALEAEGIQNLQQFQEILEKESVRRPVPSQRLVGDEGVRAFPPREAVEAIKHGEARKKFDACVDFVFDGLNDAGVIEAMRYILELSQNPKFSISTESQKKKEDTE